MEIRANELKQGAKIRKKFYKDNKLYYAEIKILKVYTYKISHSRDLRKTHTRGD